MATFFTTNDLFYGTKDKNPFLSRPRTTEQGRSHTRPQHYEGDVIPPYYRRDSMGFRRTYKQADHVDAWYEEKKKQESVNTRSINHDFLPWSHLFLAIFFH